MLSGRHQSPVSERSPKSSTQHRGKTKVAKKRPTIGDVVICVFWDHSQNMSDAVHFEVIGRIVDITKKAYKLRCWGYVQEIDRVAESGTATNNEEWYHIVKSAVDSIKVLR